MASYPRLMQQAQGLGDYCCLLVREGYCCIKRKRVGGIMVGKTGMLKYGVVALAALGAGFAGHAMYTKQSGGTTSGITMAGPVRILSGDEGRNYLAEQRAAEKKRDEERLCIADLQQASAAEKYDRYQQLLSAMFVPLSQADIELAARTGPSYFQRDQPASLVYTICRLHNEDDDKTYFVQVRSGDGETVGMYNLMGSTFIDKASTTFRPLPKIVNIGGTAYEVSVRDFEFWEDMAEARFWAKTLNPIAPRVTPTSAPPSIETTITKFATCEPLGSEKA